MATFYGKKPEDQITDPKAPVTDPVATALTGKPTSNIMAMPNKMQKDMTEQKVITDDDVAKATNILREYKSGKQNLDHRIIEDELWWEIRHWEAIGKAKKAAGDPTPNSNSAWLFNTILNKHADAMDNIPSPVVLPREKSDEFSAKTLSDVLPVIMEYNHYEDVYSSNWWEKLKHGSAVYGIVWDSQKENGLGDIEISQIDLLNLYYEPGITDIQQSKNVFITRLIDREALQKQYPDKKDELRGDAINVEEYLYDDNVDNKDKIVVVDWYYKVGDGNGHTLLQYAKFAGGCLLYASENEPQYQERGFYDHGLYPIVIDSLFPEKGTPIGFGYISICKDNQMYIDKLSSNILQNSLMDTKKRYFVSNSTAVNEDEFLDWNRPLVHVEGELSDTRLQEIPHHPVDGIYFNVLQQKIEEMKDTSANRDVNSGSASSGVTAASAIAALQEAGNKVSRDMIAASYRAYTEIVSMVIELIRQFYDEKRSFRITGKNPSEYEFASISNQMLMEQQMGISSDGSILYRKPIFDLKVKAQKRSPFSKMEENERAKELYSMGFFAPENAQAAMGALEMMDFEGLDDVKEYVQQGQTLMQMVQQQQMQIQQLVQLIGATTGVNVNNASTPNGVPEQTGDRPTEAKSGKTDSAAGDIMQSRVPMQSYANKLAKRSAPSMDTTSNRAMPK